MILWRGAAGWDTGADEESNINALGRRTTRLMVVETLLPAVAGGVRRLLSTCCSDSGSAIVDVRGD